MTIPRPVTGTIIGTDWGIPITDQVNATMASDTMHSRVTRSGVWAIPTAPTPIPFDTIDRDTVGLYSTTTHVWTVAVAGWYLAGGVLYAVATGASQVVATAVWRNGLVVARGAQTMSVGGGAMMAAVSTPLYCASGDTIAIYGNTSVALSTTYSDPANIYGSLDYLGTG